MSFTDVVTRERAAGVIPTELAKEIIKVAAEESAALSLCRRAQMSTKVYEQPVLSALVTAYWVGGDMGLKQTSAAAWEGVTLTAEEIAVIVPVPIVVFDDAQVNLWAELRPELAAAIARKLDAAVLTGADAPASWPASIAEGAVAAGNVQPAVAPAAEGAIYGDLEGAISTVEDSGFDPNAICASGRLRRRLRRARNELGDLLGEGSTASAHDLPITYTPTGLPTPNLALVGDWRMAVVGVRQDLNFEVFRDGVISDEDGKVRINLLQQDMVAIRVVGRYGYATAVPATATEEESDKDKFPFCVVTESEPERATAADNVEGAPERPRPRRR